MPVADFVGEWFESEPLRATVAAAGVLGGFAGPRSAGTTAALLWLGAGADQPIAPGWTAIGGIGAVTAALAAAARAAGVEIRTGARVLRILVRDDACRWGGAGLRRGDSRRSSLCRPRILDARMLTLVDPVHLPPEFARRIRNIRMRGTLAKVNYAVSASARVSGCAGRSTNRRARPGSAGVVRLAESVDAIERAFDAVKYGRASDVPWIELAVPSLADPTLAPAWRARGLRLRPVVPPRAAASRVGRGARTARGRCDGDHRGLRPGIRQRRSSPARSSRRCDLQETYGLTGGHIFHGELALDQLLVGRPTLGLGRATKRPFAASFWAARAPILARGLDGRSGWQAAKAVLRAIGK